MPTIRQTPRIVTLPDGRQAVVLDNVIPDDAPQAVREGLARRAIVNGGNTCPCGATWPRPNREQRRALAKAGAVVQVDVEHERDCPAATDRLLDALDAWEGTP